MGADKLCTMRINGLTVKAYTRSMNDEYFGLMRSLLPDDLDHERCQQFQEWWQAKDYIHHVLQSDADIVINIDEDCFIYDWTAVVLMINHIINSKSTHMGMPDRHLSCHRFNLYTVQNPFFNIFNMREIRHFYKGTMQTTDEQNIEPYNSIFLELAFFGKPFYLSAHDHEDGITTDLHGFALHTWYSRDPSHRARILARYNDAIFKKVNQQA